MKKHYIIFAGLVLVGILYPQMFPGYLSVAITLLLYAGWATAWDILGGPGRSA